VKLVILDTGPCLNFLSIDQGNLLCQVLSTDSTSLFIPREVATEIEDKSREQAKFSRAARVLPALVREGRISILESDAQNDVALVLAIKQVSPLLPADLLQRRRKDLGETMVIAHAIKLRAAGDEVRVVIDDGGGRTLAMNRGFVKPISTTRILATAASEGMLTYAAVKKIYERLRPSNGREPMDDGLRHWSDSGLDNRSLYRQS
jgi:predicted nucleic acid-binding protein